MWCKIKRRINCCNWSCFKQINNNKKKQIKLSNSRFWVKPGGKQEWWITYKKSLLRIGKKTLECHATLSCFCVMSYTDMLQSVQLEWKNISMWRNKSKLHYIIFPTKGKNCQFLWYCEEYISHNYPAGIYMFKVNNKNTTARCEICSKLTIKTRTSSLTE